MRRAAILTLAGICFLGAVAGPAKAQQVSPDEQAMTILDSARRAYNERKFPFAAERFAEFLKLFGGHKQAVWAHYGLALSLLDQPATDESLKRAVESLQAAVGRADFPERPMAFYRLGAAQRDWGLSALAQVQARPNEAGQLGNLAKQRFDEAAKNFASAGGAFLARAKSAPPPAQPPPPGQPPSDDLEWAARARCDHAEMLLRNRRFKESADQSAGVLAEPLLANSRYRPLATYQLGYAQFALGDYPSAGRTLAQLAPFDLSFGPHARYLLGRSHHLAGQRVEAGANYKAVLAGHEQLKASAREALKNPAALKVEQKAALEVLVNGPAPDYVARAAFYAGLLMAEEERFAEAADVFAGLVQHHPKSALAAEAQLRLGYCRMQLKSYPDAIKMLAPLCENPPLADQALWWTARSQAAAADPANAAAYEQALKSAVEQLRRAADLAGKAAATDPMAKARRIDILAELGDTLVRARQPKEAAVAYQQALAEGPTDARAEELSQRRVTALHLAGQFKESDDLARQFERTYPKSTLLAAVLFRSAENAYLTATAAAADPKLPNREPQLAALFGEAVNRYQRLLKEYPEFEHVQLARQGLGGSLYRLGRFGETIAVLGAIPQAERVGELASANYLLADCLIRGLPGETDDAVSAARVLESAGQAAQLLEAFLSSAGKSPQAPDATLKLGYCHQRIAMTLAKPEDRNARLMQARQLYDKLLQQFPNDPSAPVATFERAKCLALLGDVNGAINEMNRFRADPLAGSPVAPMALIRLASLMRAAGRNPEAAKMLAEGRARHEPVLLKDPARSDWVALFQYEQGLAVKDSGKPAEAKPIFEEVVKQFAGRPEAINAAWRLAQCRRDALAGVLSTARATWVRPKASAEELAAANQAAEQAMAELRRIAGELSAQADGLAKQPDAAPAVARLIYESAWCSRLVGQAECELARRKLAEAALQKALARLAAHLPPDQVPAPLRLPDVPLSAVPVQPGEEAARAQYRRLIAAAPTSPLAGQARLELAELLAEREQNDAALELLAEAMEHHPPAELVEPIRLRLAATLLAAGSPATALTHAQAVEKARHGQPPSPPVILARLLSGEARVQQKDWPKAIELLTAFRDQGPFQAAPDISDRAMLRLGRAYAESGQWDPSRQAFEILVQRFPQSPWVPQAYFGVGQAWQRVGQLDNAVNAYAEVARRTVAELAAQAQLQAGLCRMAQNRFAEAAKALLVVPLTYDYPELSAQALYEAGRAYAQAKQPEEAVKVWTQVVGSYPASPWAEQAKQRLAEVEKSR